MANCIPIQEISTQFFPTVQAEVDADHDQCLTRSEVDQYLDSNTSIEKLNDELRRKMRETFGQTLGPKLSFHLSAGHGLPSTAPSAVKGHPPVISEKEVYPLATSGANIFAFVTQFSYFPFGNDVPQLMHVVSFALSSAQNYYLGLEILNPDPGDRYHYGFAGFDFFNAIGKTGIQLVFPAVQLFFLAGGRLQFPVIDERAEEGLNENFGDQYEIIGLFQPGFETGLAFVLSFDNEQPSMVLRSGVERYGTEQADLAIFFSFGLEIDL